MSPATTKISIARRAAGEPLSLAARRWLEERPSQGVLLTDPTGAICGWNRWLERHADLAESEVLGKKLVDVFPSLEARGAGRFFADALRGQVVVVSQRLHGYLLPLPTSAGGSRYDHMQQSAQIAPLYEGETIVGTIAVISDVTDRVARDASRESELVARAHRLSEELITERAQLAQAHESNRAKDEFLAVLSHELRTPLHAILGWAQVLGEGSPSAEKLVQGLAAIERNAQTQTQLIEDLLDVSRIVADDLRIDMKPVRVRRPIEAAVDAIRPLADARGIGLTVAIDDDVGLVIGDVDRLQQIVWHLLRNTIKFTPAGGQVSVAARFHDARVSIVVSDSGAGIAPEFLPHVFDRFRQSDSSITRPQGGLGLGLSIVKGLVELHGGTVTAASNGVGHGATFIVTLPSAADDHAATPLSSVAGISASRIAAATEAAPLAGVRILFVDDDADGREVMAMALVAEGAFVTIAGSAVEARVLLRADPPDVMISDIGMPGEDGYALIKSIRAMSSDVSRTPAFALTGYAGLEDRKRARDAGFDGFLTKPVDLAAMVRQVVKLVRK